MDERAHLPKGKVVRADYSLVEAEEERRLLWRQELEESPFERILAESNTEIQLAPDDGGTRVAVALTHRPRGWARLSPFQLRAAATRQVEEALEGLERVLGPGEEPLTMRWWGWGEDGADVELPDAGAALW